MAEDDSTKMTLDEAIETLHTGINDGIAEIRASLGRIQTDIENHAVECCSVIDGVSKILKSYEEMATRKKEMKEAYDKLYKLYEK